MRNAARFVGLMIVLLAGLSWAASRIVDETSRRWFERDVALRGQLAVSGARIGLIRAWRAGDADAIGRLLAEVTRDERIMASEACSPDGSVVARTAEYPVPFGCEQLAPHLRARADVPPDGWHDWTTLDDLAGGRVHVNAMPIVDGDQPLGFVAVVHDMSFADRRSVTGQRFTWIVFGLLGLAASVVTLLVAGATWRHAMRGIRDALSGKAPRPEFQPLVSDLRELVAQLAAEHELPSGGAWTPERLKSTLHRHLEGERIVMVANREPYIHEKSEGGTRLQHPASGLVTALEPVMRACSGVWVAHGSGSADREHADRHGRLWVPPEEKSFQLRRVWLSGAEEKGYYYGFSNEGLWPLCHVAHTRPLFRSDDWEHYRRVNQRFADAACEEANGEDPIILVQDYHFALAPKMIRDRLPRATILTFWHIPWPNSERVGICPWHDELIEGLLGSSIVGFHTQFHCNNFIETVERFLEARIDREHAGVVHGGRTTLVRPYPISIEWPSRWALTAPPVDDCRSSVRAELGLPPDALLGVGVDRLDYTKGIEERLAAVERLLERHPSLRGKFTFVQLAAPSRSIIEHYRELAARVEELAARINGRFGTASYKPVVLLRSHHEPPTVFRYYRAADACYVSSVHDGMNLVAKEFVAARDDEAGVLVLSRFTGAARELTQALIVNPYDLDEASEALATALRMSREEQRQRMAAMRSLLGHFNVYRWAGRMLIDAAQLRRTERLTGRLSHQRTWLEGLA